MKRLLSGLMAMLVILSLCAGCGEPAPTTGSTPCSNANTDIKMSISGLQSQTMPNM